jgi:hypothetical protein
MRNRVFTSSIKHVYVAGDLHGDYEHFRKILHIFETSGKGSLLLFLGDYADRGLHGSEIIIHLNRLLDNRKDIVCLKGNHEIYRNGRPVFSPCDLIYEAETKQGSWKKFYRDTLLGFLGKLHVAGIINRVLFVHAGISSGIRSAKDLENPENEANLLWSDPSSIPGEHPDRRGAGIAFGEDITTEVLSSLGTKIMVRSHEPDKAAEGPYIEHGGRVVTINSCTSYCESIKPFILKVDTEKATYKPIFL